LREFDKELENYPSEAAAAAQAREIAESLKQPPPK